MVSMQIFLWAFALPIVTVAHPVQDSVLLEPNFDFDGFNTSSQQHYGHLNKRISLKCSGTSQTTLTAGITQAIAMIKDAKTAANNVYTILSDRTAAYQLGQQDEIRIQFETWCAIFGCGDAKFPLLTQSEIDDIVDRAKYVKTAFDTLATSMDNHGQLRNEFWCSDDWLTKTSPSGDVYKDGNGNTNDEFFWDNRPDRPEKDTDGWLQIADDKCDDDTMAFTIAQMWGYNGDVITHCGTFFTNTWNPAQAAGQTLQGVCTTKYSVGANPSFDGLVRDKLARSIVHELMHSINAVGLATTVDGLPYTEIDDQKCPGSDTRAYGWQCIVELAKESSSLAMKNADSYSYFAAAVYCKKNNWATGYPNIVSLYTKALKESNP